MTALPTEPAPKGFKWWLVPDYPEGEVKGPCICGSWPGGECLRCPVLNDPNCPNPPSQTAPGIEE